MIKHNPTCITCGATLANHEIKRDANNLPVRRGQKCFMCKKAGRK